MATPEKLPLLQESDEVFESSSSDDGFDYGSRTDRLPSTTGVKTARDIPRPSLARASLPTLGLHRRPASFRRRVRSFFTTGCLLTAVLLECITYFGIVGNLVLFCTNGLGLSSAVGVTVDLVFIGSCSCSAVTFTVCVLSISRDVRRPVEANGIRHMGHQACCLAKNYENWLAVDKVIAKIIRLTFLAHPVVHDPVDL